jgi:hypothetical protein
MRKTWILVLLVIGAVWIYYRFGGGFDFTNSDQLKIGNLKKNYGAEIDVVCGEMQLSSSYFKALAILECSGERPSKTRFEPHIYQKLKDVQIGKSERYGKFTTKQLEVVSNSTLEKLATSWGPFQIMGYHCIPMGVEFEQLQGEEAIFYGVQWVEKTYGKYLRAGDYRNAFHIHNTGQPLPESGIPKTHNPQYIDKGLEYMKVFEEEN